MRQSHWVFYPVAGRGNAPQVNDEIIDISDSDHDQPMLAHDNGIIDMTQLSDSDESTPPPSPSKSARKSVSSGSAGLLSMTVGLSDGVSSHSHSPLKVREVNGILEILDSDEDPSPSTSRIESSISPMYTIRLPRASIAGHETAQSPLETSDAQVIICIEHTPPLESPLSPKDDIEMDLDVSLSSPMISAEESDNSNHVRRAPHVDPHANTSSVLTNPESSSLKVIYYPHETIQSLGPAAAETSAGSLSDASTSAHGLLSVIPIGTHISVPGQLASPTPTTVHSPDPAAVAPPLPSLLLSHEGVVVEPSSRHSAGTPAGSSPHTVASHTASDPIWSLNPEQVIYPLRRPFLPQIRTDPSVPLRPAVNAVDVGTPHHGPDGLFKHVLQRPDLSQTRRLSNLASCNTIYAQSSKSAPSPVQKNIGVAHDNRPASISSGIRTDGAQCFLAPGTEIQTTIETEQVSTHSRDRVSKRELPVTLPYSQHRPLSQGVSNQACDPGNVIDLTLDDDDGTQHHPMESVPESVLHGARRLVSLLAAETDSISVQGENHDVSDMVMCQSFASYYSMISFGLR
jgi:hypothetical protein